MAKHNLEELYFDWMYSLVSRGEYRTLDYRMLLQKLFDIPFSYILPMDDNRGMDGINLRYEFGEVHEIPDSAIATMIDVRECSVLEMMVALARRCETNITFNPEYGDRTPKWFWGMVDSLGLLEMTDEYFDENYVEEVIDKFLRRKYEPDGRGGLFTVPNSSKDLRKVEIWYQLHSYLHNEEI